MGPAPGQGTRWTRTFPLSTLASPLGSPGLWGGDRLGAQDPQPLLLARSVLFNPDGCCLYSGCQDSLRVYGWEPERCFDVVLVNWGKVADLAICNDQLVREPRHPPPTLLPSHCPPHPGLSLPSRLCR